MAEFKYSVMDNKALGNVFRNSHNSFHTFLRSSGLNNRGFWSFFKLNNGIFIYKNAQNFSVNANVIVKVEEWSIASIIWVGSSWKGVKTLITEYVTKSFFLISNETNYNRNGLSQCNSKHTSTAQNQAGTETWLCNFPLVSEIVTTLSLLIHSIHL